jgi:hypothetical protein
MEWIGIALLATNLRYRCVFPPSHTPTVLTGFSSSITPPPSPHLATLDLTRRPDTTPASRSEWPPMNLVPDERLRSTPNTRGWIR